MIFRGSLLGLCGIATSYAAGADAPALKEPALADMAQWLWALTAVLIALFLFAWIARRLGHFSRVESGSFRVLGALSLGSRERVILVQAGTKQLVLGVAPGCVRTLCILDGDEAVAVKGEGSVSASFSEHLASVLVRGKK